VFLGQQVIAQAMVATVDTGVQRGSVALDHPGPTGPHLDLLRESRSSP